jgi:hypothetical protein
LVTVPFITNQTRITKVTLKHHLRHSPKQKQAHTVHAVPQTNINNHTTAPNPSHPSPTSNNPLRRCACVGKCSALPLFTTRHSHVPADVLGVSMPRTSTSIRTTSVSTITSPTTNTLPLLYHYYYFLGIMYAYYCLHL